MFRPLVTVLVFALFLGVIQTLSIQTLPKCSDSGVRVPSADPRWVCNSQNGTWDYPGNLTLSVADVLIMDATLHVYGDVIQSGWTCVPDNNRVGECSNFDQDAIKLKVGVFNEGLSIRLTGGLMVDGKLDGLYRLDVDSDKRIQVNPDEQSSLPLVILHSYDGYVPFVNPVVGASATDAFKATRLSCENAPVISPIASLDPVGDNQHSYTLFIVYFVDGSDSCRKKQDKAYDDYVDEVTNNPATTTTGSSSVVSQTSERTNLIKISLFFIVLHSILGPLL